MLSELLQASRGICGSGLVVEMPAELVDFGRRGGQANAFVVALLIAAPAGEDIHAEPACTGEPGVRLRCDCRGDAAWKHQHRNEARTNDSERDFLHAGDHDVESRLRRRDDRKPEQRHGVAGQHESVTARCAVDEREV